MEQNFNPSSSEECKYLSHGNADYTDRNGRWKMVDLINLKLLRLRVIHSFSGDVRLIGAQFRSAGGIAHCRNADELCSNDA